MQAQVTLPALLVSEELRNPLDTQLTRAASPVTPSAAPTQPFMQSDPSSEPNFVLPDESQFTDALKLIGQPQVQQENAMIAEERNLGIDMGIRGLFTQTATDVPRPAAADVTALAWQVLAIHLTIILHLSAN